MQMANNMGMMRPGNQMEMGGNPMMGPGGPHPHMRPQMNPQMMPMHMQQQQQSQQMQMQNRPPPPEYGKMMPHQVRKKYQGLMSQVSVIMSN